jgi:hypothetical protein
MWRHGLIGLLAAAVMGIPAAAAGLKFLTVPADASGPLDRAQFHEQFNNALIKFFRTRL